LLTLTKADAIYTIHKQYLEAGSDMVETNTFSSTSIAQLDYALEDYAYRLNKEGAALAKRACQDVNSIFLSNSTSMSFIHHVYELYRSGRKLVFHVLYVVLWDQPIVLHPFHLPSKILRTETLHLMSWSKLILNRLEVFWMVALIFFW
jgi:hypothetical protein